MKAAACPGDGACGTTLDRDVLVSPARLRSGPRSPVIRLARASRGLTIAIRLLGRSAHAAPIRCEPASGARQIASALETIRRSIDPCGESAQLVDVVERFERCAMRYEICVDGTASRNLMQAHGAQQTGTIIWNPELRSELEAGCDGDASRAVMRDPVASLVHELMHAVDDCEGRAAASREDEAVRLENVYRRAAGLCQRTAYGDLQLERGPFSTCGRDATPVTSARREPDERHEAPRPAADGQAAAPALSQGETGLDPAGHSR